MIIFLTNSMAASTGRQAQVQFLTTAPILMDPPLSWNSRMKRIHILKHKPVVMYKYGTKVLQKVT